MKIQSILTKRKIESWPSYHLVYEWEDVFIEDMNIFLKFETSYSSRIDRIMRKIKMIFTNNKTLLFQMIPRFELGFYSKKNIIPVIIDFHIALEDLDKFNLVYKSYPLVLVSNKEAVNFLQKNNSPVNYQHFPLSLPDKYKISENEEIEKKWDLILMGRQNPILMGWLHEFEKKHSQFIYVYRKIINKKFNYYTNKGEFLGNIESREDYMKLLKKSRIGFYSTPGIDGGEERTKGFNQVTPRFLEMIACKCNVIARYPKNADTDFYELNKLCKNIESYKQFEIQMEKALNTEIPIDKYKKYMKKHYTSERVKLLQQILENN